MMKVSIIVPVYNTERYIKECVESILHQSYEYFEVIFIDDGSQDNSYSIINEFANRDKRIKLYHQDNAGVSAARNLGLKYATGDYIAFIDSDDTIGSDYLYKLCNCIIKYSPDLVLSGIQNRYNEVLEEGLLSLQTEAELITFFKTPLQTSPVSKLYKRQIISENNIQFDTSISFAEDKDFNLKYFQHIKNAYALSYCGYFYREVVTSLSHKRYEYRYRIEHKHWAVKKRMFESLNDFSLQGKSYLVNQLVYLIYDEMSDIACSKMSLEDMMNSWRASMSYIDFDYIEENYSLLNQPFWMKSFLKWKLYRIIFMILKKKNRKNGETAC